jgi:proteasome lid subunit RPN8/RPN11
MRLPWTPPERLEIARSSWRELLGELARRGRGKRESGAFLLGAAESRLITDVAYFDDLDPHCLKGNIEFDVSGFTALFKLCRQKALRVVADVHTHPRGWVDQSHIDKLHPMIAMAGHVGLIVPFFAQQSITRDQVGFHLYQGETGWQAHHGRAARRRISLR